MNRNKKLTTLSFIVTWLIISFNLPVSNLVPDNPTQLNNNDSDQVGVYLPLSNTTVANAGDYRVHMVATAKPGSAATAVNYLGFNAGATGPALNTFMHAGLYVTHEGVTWFAAGTPNAANAPDVDCLRGKEEWLDLYQRHTGCLGDVGDLELDLNIWTRVQFVTYDEGYWIVRISNQRGDLIDVAKIYNPHTTFAIRVIISM